MTQSVANIVRLNPRDNVGLAPVALKTGALVDSRGVSIRERIPAGHKVCTAAIDAGAPVYKYGQIIGFASRKILAGEHVHTHNVGMQDFTREYAIGADVVPTEYNRGSEQSTFKGYRRSNGRVGTRNFVGVLATVSCSAGVSRCIADELEKEILEDYPAVDGVVALGHGLGCCMTPGGEGLTILQKTLAGYARNPNFGGVLLVGLGCEVNLLETLMQNMDLSEGPELRSLNIQLAGGTRNTIRMGVDLIRAMLPSVAQARRQDLSAEHLVLGLECGGSDAYSGITANPAMGAAVDLLVRNGGTAILSETPEIYGAEHLLTRRAVDPEVAQKLIAKIHWWESYTRMHAAEINNNPTPGNKAGGLTTILEKSLGAVAKAGTTNLVDVFGYADTVRAKGLVFMDSPGYDVVSITGMIAGGANLICFTTGRGTVCGFKPVPTIKLASNSTMFRHLRDDMDVNCGLIVDGQATVSQMGARIYQLLLDTASGQKTCSERHGFGAHEFVPWHIGAVL